MGLTNKVVPQSFKCKVCHARPGKSHKMDCRPPYEYEYILTMKDRVICGECSGVGEIGLADGEITCPKCLGSGDPTRPGPFKPKDIP